MASSTAVPSHLPIRMTSIVVRGFGRGSTELGIPTANLDFTEGTFHSTYRRRPLQDGSGGPEDEVPTGIYWGFARIGKDPFVYKTACSIGYNPTYGNTTKTIEPHLIAPETDPKRHASHCGESSLGDFYGQPIRLSLVGYLRPELPFEGLEKLIHAIKNDIVNSDRLGDGMEPETVREKEWVASEELLV